MLRTAHLDVLHSGKRELPEWFKQNPLGAPEDAPPEYRCATPLAGMPAGSAMINWTDIVHRRTDNTTPHPRRTFWQVFRRQGEGIGDRLCAHLSQEYRARQTDPTRIALLDDRMLREAGGDFWRLEDLEEASPFWPYRLDAVLARLRAGGRQARPAL